jgi:hypothetical protein
MAFPRQGLEGPQGPQPGLPPMDAIIALRSLPAMLAVGMPDTALLPEYVIPAFKLSYPDAPVVEIPDAGHVPTEDAPQDSAGTARTVPADDARAHLNPSSDYNSPNLMENTQMTDRNPILITGTGGQVVYIPEGLDAWNEAPTCASWRLP